MKLFNRKLIRSRIRLRNSVNLLDLMYIIAGSTMLAFGLADFLIPHHIAGPGLKGLATIKYHMLNIPVGMTILVVNLVLIPLQAKMIGRKIAWKTLLSVVVNSFAIEFFMRALPFSTKDPILACLYGGIICGVGIGLIIKAGGTPGGIDIISHLVHHRYHMPVGDVMLLCNLSVAILAGFAYGPELALYGFLTVFLIGKATDAVLEGMSIYRTVFVMSKHADEIGWAIIEDLHRGVTCLTGYGVYTSQPAEVLMTAIKRTEIADLRQLIHEIDPNAFIVIGEAKQVIGKGFVSLKNEVRREKDI